jgi:hypothetical protein
MDNVKVGQRYKRNDKQYYGPNSIYGEDIILVTCVNLGSAQVEHLSSGRYTWIRLESFFQDGKNRSLGYNLLDDAT